MTESSKAAHYRRLRDRFLSGEPGSRSEEALLELILSFSVKRGDVKPIAKELLLRFGTLFNVIAASPEELKKISGLGESSPALLKVIDLLRSDPPLPDTTEPVPMAGEIPSLDRAKDVSSRRKFQVSNGYLLEFDQLGRILHHLLANREANKISRSSLRDNTGLADRQVESLISIGTALGLIEPRRQTLTRLGTLVAENDIFIEKRGTLEWFHYVAAGAPRNLVWFEIFNALLSQSTPMTQKGWCEELRNRLAGQYTERTIGKHLHEEVRFIVDAYFERNFRKLELLGRTSEGLLHRRRYTSFEPLVLSAMIYDFGAVSKASLLQVGDFADTPGSPALLFGLDTATFRSLVEGLHDKGFVLYETTHGLDQIRLKPSLSGWEFLSAYFEGRDIRERRPGWTNGEATR